MEKIAQIGEPLSRYAITFAIRDAFVTARLHQA
jgi:hypothetical protein